ncbi:MAG: adenylate/guanylate cyclase domain-containing protein [Myxococcales bacterium]|nr:adenylate/guanylate cyclase domain-containing protein [Myxococcales bacterium]
MIGLGPIEATLLPARAPTLMLIRYGFIVPVTTAAMILIVVPRLAERVTRRHPQEWVLITSALVFAGVGSMGVVVLRSGGFEHHLYGAFAYMLSAVFIYLALRLRFTYATLLGWSTYLLSVAIIVGLGGASLVTMMLMFSFCFVANLLGMFGCYLVDRFARQHYLALQHLELERGRVERLLLNILPGPIARRLKDTGRPIADGHDEVTVLFADIVGFTELSQRLDPAALVAVLNRLFSSFDELCERHGVEKIKTIGDAYMAAAGLPTPRPDHAEAIARVALEMRALVERFAAADAPGERVQLRVGIHSGPVVAGVIGAKKFIYDLWGDTVNTASRMESHALSGQIQVSEDARARLEREFVLRERGVVDVKGKGPMRVYWLEGARA